MAEQCAVLDGCESHWLIPTACGYIAADLDIISGLPRHTELIDGSLVVAGRQTLFHMRMLRLLEGELDSQASERFAIQRGMTVMLDPKQRPEPDIMIVWASAEVSLDQTDFKPEDVLLVAEVVSSESCVRDRVRKPQLYAKAGFRCFLADRRRERTARRLHVRAGPGNEELRADRHPPWPADRLVAVPDRYRPGRDRASRAVIPAQ
jgi:hypothetical protein